ncbi:MAG: ATP-binding cassette domain-containing protein, partial [Blastocatellia bacterium]
LAQLVAEGLTILVATPYLDEAERCRRVALMNLGEIQQMGAPAELCASMRAVRIEMRASNLGEAERSLSDIAGPDEKIIDVQRFGDRLDLLAIEPEEATLVLQKRMSDAGLRIDEVRVAEPTLENTFVATLRGLGQELREAPFPSRHDHSELRGQTAIDAHNLTKQFGTFTAVKDVSLQVQYGEIYGLLGANGAGKTTTIKMLCGLLEPTSGEMRLVGERSLRSGGVRRQIGYMSQKFSLYNDLSIGENLDFFAGVYGVSDAEREEKNRWVLAFSGLEGKEGQITGSLPGGWKQRVAFGAAIMHEPRALFLDEPTSGVDPLARRAFWKMINRLADAGAAILITTHYLEESEQCNRLGMMVAGELVAEGSPSGLKSRQTGCLLEFVVDHPQRASGLLKREAGRWRVSIFGDRLHVITDEDPQSCQRAITEELEANGIHVRDAREGRFSMEDVFISVVEKARQEGKVASED